MLELTVDKGGRVVIPKSLRRELRLQAGDKLAVEQQGEGMILRPIRTAVALKKKYGVWVYGTGDRSSVSSADLVEQDRERRVRELSK
jgi:AbrB family looped-hinge helix DNA binding protein